MFAKSTSLNLDGQTPTTPYTIRPLAHEDAPWVRTFWIEHWGSEIMVAHSEIIRPEGLPGFVAENEGRVLGLATYRVNTLNCELISLDSLVEGQGIGTSLLEAVIEAARAAGCNLLRLTTTNDNLYALRFYQKRGFRLAALRPGAVDKARRIKPSIPMIGNHGIPIRDELELGKNL